MCERVTEHRTVLTFSGEILRLQNISVLVISAEVLILVLRSPLPMQESNKQIAQLNMEFTHSAYGSKTLAC